MNQRKCPSLSKASKTALKLMGLQIRAARLERGISQQNLGERINASRFTVMAIEKGDPKVAIGYVFEAANTVGIPLFSVNANELEKEAVNVSHFTALLPQRVRKKKEDLDDNF